MAQCQLEMSQQEAAEWAGLSRTEIYQIEHGLTDEKITTMFRVCLALRMSLQRGGDTHGPRD
jgi:DNA-binding XRE family transcriptional regulator